MKAGVSDLQSRRRVNRAIDALAQAQHGLITRQQLGRYLSPSEVDSRLKRGVLLRVRPGVYRLPGVPQTWTQEVLAVCLSYAGSTVASHRSAARLWALEGVPSQRLEVTVRTGRSARMPGVISHRAEVMSSDATHRCQVPVTTIERTLIDLSGVVSAASLERAVDDALRQGHTTVVKLAKRLQPVHPGRGRRLATLRRVVAERGPGYRAGDSDWEDRLYRWIVNAGLPRPERQCWVVVDGTRRRLDLAYPDVKVAIEFDGWETHQLRRHFDDDRVRTIALQLAGWLVLLFTSRSTEGDVVDKVRRALANRSG
jgi:very-short-patch-repair endonuclease